MKIFNIISLLFPLAAGSVLIPISSTLSMAQFVLLYWYVIKMLLFSSLFIVQLYFLKHPAYGILQDLSRHRRHTHSV